MKMAYPYVVGEHDRHGVTVCYIKNQRTGEIIRDGLSIDEAEELADILADEADEDEDEF
jgi:hypothetical protein